MPWRETRDPYRILVSEVMLQQTQVDRVRVKYETFLAAFPDLAALVALPGIGAATAAPIRAFAFDAPVVFVETNIRRVFIHEFFPGREAIADAEVLPLVAAALDGRSPRERVLRLLGDLRREGFVQRAGSQFGIAVGEGES